LELLVAVIDFAAFLICPATFSTTSTTLAPLSLIFPFMARAPCPFIGGPGPFMARAPCPFMGGLPCPLVGTVPFLRGESPNKVSSKRQEESVTQPSFSSAARVRVRVRVRVRFDLSNTSFRIRVEILRFYC
jgi:hypothetical protein